MVTIHALDRVDKGQALGLRLMYPGCHIKVYKKGKLIKEYTSEQDAPKYSSHGLRHKSCGLKFPDHQ